MAADVEAQFCHDVRNYPSVRATDDPDGKPGLLTYPIRSTSDRPEGMGTKSLRYDYSLRVGRSLLELLRRIGCAEHSTKTLALAFGCRGVSPRFAKEATRFVPDVMDVAGATFSWERWPRRFQAMNENNRGPVHSSILRIEVPQCFP